MAYPIGVPWSEGESSQKDRPEGRKEGGREEIEKRLREVEVEGVAAVDILKVPLTFGFVICVGRGIDGPENTAIVYW